MRSQKSIAELGRVIHERAKALDQCIESQQGHAADPFSPDAPPAVLLPTDLQVARDELEEAVEELLPRLRGPVPHLLDKAGPRSITAFTAIHALTALAIPKLLRTDESCSIGTLASRCSSHIDVDDLTRLLRAAISHRVFDEPRRGYVAHNTASLALARDPDLRAWMAFVSRDLVPAQACLLDAMQTWPGSGRPAETAWSVSNARRWQRDPGSSDGSTTGEAVSTKKTMTKTTEDSKEFHRGFFDCLRDDSRLAEDFARAMKIMQRAPAESVAKMVPVLCELLAEERGKSQLPEDQDLLSGSQDTSSPAVKKVDDTEILIVDVGGSTGAVSASILRSLPFARAVVQDTPSALSGVAGTGAGVPSSESEFPSHTHRLASDTGHTAGNNESAQALAPPASVTAPSSAPTVSHPYKDIHDRLTFSTHDFFKPQPEHLARTADIYFLRMVLHDWSDERARAILQALVPALKTKAGSRVIVNALCLPLCEEGTGRRLDEQAFYSYDLLMKGLLNGRERDEDGWHVLAQSAHSDLRVMRVRYVKGSVQALIEIGVSGDSHKR